jgi:hypothetical protein
LYRGVLSEKDVVGGFPEATLSNQRRTELQNYFNAFYSDFLNDTIFNVCMASGVPNPTNVRIVNNFVVEAKLVSKKTNNRYFKRNPGVPGPDGV